MVSVRAKLRLIPRALWVFLLVQLVLVVVLLFNMGALFRVGDAETLRAVGTQQRVIIDAKTGKILSGVAVRPPTNAELIPAYDVATTPEKTPADTPVETAPETPADPEPAASVNGNALDMGKEPEITPIPRSNASLVPAPAPEVSDTTDDGILPKTGGKDITSARVYGRRYAWAQDEPKPAIALLVSGLGMNARSMQAALTLPADIAFGFTPYGDNSPRWVEWARNDGHEVWMVLPAQTLDFPRTDPGPYGVFKGLEAAAIVARMHKAMLRFPGYVGMVLPLEQAALSESAVAVPMLEELGKRGLMLAVPSSADALSTLAHLEPHRRDIIEADAVIDSTPSEAFIRARLAKLEEQAKTNGRVFAVVSDTPLSLQLVAEWAGTLAKKDIELVPLSAWVRTAEDDAPPPEPEKKESAH